ncbi:MAG: Zn-dependent hydrolase [Castellaniella sp.]
MNPQPGTGLRVDGARLWNSLMEHGRIGATDKGGVRRLALSALDGEGRALFTQWAREAGCEIRVDAIGNIFARRPGSDNSLAPVMAGSHLDTQPTGGRFDGIYGVLAALEVVRTLNDHAVQTRAPVEVVVWTNEEGSRFVPVMMGSGVAAGAFGLDYALQQKDSDGISVGEALQAIGYAGSEAPVLGSVKSYFEAHIEQGPLLEAREITIGAVTGALGQRWYNIAIIGDEAHAGPTPMDMRKDALLPASHVVQLVNALALEQGPQARGTVGSLNVHPDSRNVIPGRVDLTVDFRAPTDGMLNAMAEQLQERCATLAADHGMTIHIEPTVYFPPQPFDARLIDSVRDSAHALGLSCMDIVSGAGHDAVYMARLTPTAMIFIPCKDGISHNEREDALPEHVEAGANVLLQAVLAEAEVV